MTLEGLVFDVQGGVKVELKLELVVDGDGSSFLASVPVKVIYGGMVSKEGHLTYDLGKGIFITALTDFFSEATDYNQQQVTEIAQMYSDLLEKGKVKIKEEYRDLENGEVSKVKVYKTLNDYRISLVKRKLKELKSQ